MISKIKNMENVNVMQEDFLNMCNDLEQTITPTHKKIKIEVDYTGRLWGTVNHEGEAIIENAKSVKKLMKKMASLLLEFDGVEEVYFTVTKITIA